MMKTRSQMTGTAYRRVLIDLGLTHAQAAKELGIGIRSSMRHAKSDKVPKLIALAVRGLQQMHRRQGQGPAN